MPGTPVQAVLSSLMTKMQALTPEPTATDRKDEALPPSPLQLDEATELSALLNTTSTSMTRVYTEVRRSSDDPRR